MPFPSIDGVFNHRLLQILFCYKEGKPELGRPRIELNRGADVKYYLDDRHSARAKQGAALWGLTVSRMPGQKEACEINGRKSGGGMQTSTLSRHGSIPIVLLMI